MALLNRDLVDHGLYRSALSYPAEGHEHSARAYGRVEALRKPPLGADVEIGRDPEIILLECAGDVLSSESGGRRLDAYMLFSSVGVEEGAAYVHHLLPVPAEHEALLLGHVGDLDRLEVLLLGEL